MHQPEELHGATDDDLVQRIGEGCEDSFRVFFQRWAPPLERFLRRATGSRETSEDLVQEAFIRILRAAPRFERRGSVGAWVYRIGANLARSYWRHELASPLRSPEFWNGAAPQGGRWTPTGPAPAGRPGGAPGPSPGDAQPPTLESLQQRRAIERAAAASLDRCSADQRLVFLLKADQGLTYEEIAAVLKCPVGTAKSRFHFAVRRLRQDLADLVDRPGTRGREPHDGRAS